MPSSQVPGEAIIVQHLENLGMTPENARNYAADWARPRLVVDSEGRPRALSRDGREQPLVYGDPPIHSLEALARELWGNAPAAIRSDFHAKQVERASVQFPVQPPARDPAHVLSAEERERRMDEMRRDPNLRIL